MYYGLLGELHGNMCAEFWRGWASMLVAVQGQPMQVRQCTLLGFCFPLRLLLHRLIKIC